MTTARRTWTVGLLLLAWGSTGCTTGDDRDEAVSRFRDATVALTAEAERDGVSVIPGVDGWRFFAPEVRHLSVGRFWGDAAPRVSRARNADAADPLPAILDFEAQLADLGVALLLVPVPPKSAIYADRLGPALDLPSPPPRVDPEHVRFYDTLREHGLDVLDLTDTFLAQRPHPEGPLYCRTDTHWSGVGAVVAAQAISAHIGPRPRVTAAEPLRVATRWSDLTIRGDLVNEAEPARIQETLRIRTVVPDAGGTVDETSPLVLLGDSHNLVFHAGGDMHATAAGLPDQLATEVGLPVDLVAVRGAGATAARVSLLRRAQRDAGYWSAKRLVVWVFAARELTEADGWSRVPVAP